MIRLSLLFVAAGIAALVFSQIASRPPLPQIRNADLVGSWVAGGADTCGSGEAAILTVTADGRAAVDAEAYSVSGRLAETEGVRDSLFRSRTLTYLRLFDDQANRWQFLLDSNTELTALDIGFTYRQAAGGEFMVLPRLPRLFRCR